MFREAMVQQCIEACLACQVECERCSTNCLLDGNATDCAHCIQLNRDCSEVCVLVARFLAQNSDFAQAACELAVEICVACRDECGRHEREWCQSCAQACHRAAEACERLVLQPVS